ncbi:TetR/AcrR family transcriptional regulator C-terminal domain-containing protein [Kitasatospora sp. MBT63]|uniref:TetR/AcrR family transcriptional regulator C-terminal domain-containing protein n=1 Tax=Kitasatospora sp. MBT63 TaxID=1444768 RepID=UPI000689F1C1|nr:TetR/AcrR family transcriptional regulator C-terminal domain-containing protein [Kitasatospora sp. MBT63]
MTALPGAGEEAATPQLTREALVTAALRILERDGVNGLSMRRLAAELGVKAASLYWHVRNKEQLLDLLTDALMADAVPPPRRGSWRDQLREYGLRHRSHLLGRRDAAKVVAGRLAPGPHLLRLMEDQLDRLREAGFSDADAAQINYLLGAYVHGFVLQEITPLSAAEAAGTGRAEVARAAGDQLRGLPADRYPNLVDLADDLTTPTMDERFAFGLERLLDGLAVLLEQARAAAPEAADPEQEPTHE